MAKYRNRTTGEVKTKSELKVLHKNVSFPAVWGSETLDALNVDPVLESPKPTVSGPYKSIAAAAPVQDSNGNWVEFWEEIDMFVEFTDLEGVTHTKSEQEQAYQSMLDEDAAKIIRKMRDDLLLATDYLALSDNTLSTEMSTYRQALRDITTQEGFPHDVTWPSKP
jgi:hypothetical protein